MTRLIQYQVHYICTPCALRIAAYSSITTADDSQQADMQATKAADDVITEYSSIFMSPTGA